LSSIVIFLPYQLPFISLLCGPFWQHILLDDCVVTANVLLNE